MPAIILAEFLCGIGWNASSNSGGIPGWNPVEFQGNARNYSGGIQQNPSRFQLKFFRNSGPLWTGIPAGFPQNSCAIFTRVEVRRLKTKFLSEGSIRFLPCCTIKVTFDERFIFHWSPSNSSYHSNNTDILSF